MGNISILNGHTIKDSVARKSHDNLVNQVNEAFASINTEFTEMNDRLNGLEAGGGGGATVALRGDSGTLSDDDYALCTLPNTTIAWTASTNTTGSKVYFRLWSFVSPTYTYIRIFANSSECIIQKIEIDQVSHAWVKSSETYSGGGSGSGSGSSSGGGGTAIANVNTLPNNPDETVLYRVPVDSGEKCTLFSKVNGEISSGDFLYGLPLTLCAVNTEEEKDAYCEKWQTNTDTAVLILRKDNNSVYYLNPSNPDSFDTQIEFLLMSVGFAYGGVITSKDQAENDEYFYFLVEQNAPSTALYHYKNGSWVRVDSGIIDVEEFPTQNIRTDVFYRTKEKSDVYATMNGAIDDISGIAIKWYVVPELPEVGKPATLGTFASLYFCEADKMVYGYTQGMWVTYTALLAGFNGVPEAYIMPMIGGIYRYDELPDSLDASKIYVVYTPKSNHEMKYFYENAWHNAKPSLFVKEVKSIAELGLALMESKNIVDVIFEFGRLNVVFNDGSGYAYPDTWSLRFTVGNDVVGINGYYTLKSTVITSDIMVTVELIFNYDGSFWMQKIYGFGSNANNTAIVGVYGESDDNTCFEDISKITIISRG